MDTQHSETLIESATNNDGLLLEDNNLNDRLNNDNEEDDGEISNDEPEDNLQKESGNETNAKLLNVGDTVNIGGNLNRKVNTKALQEDELDYEEDLEEGETGNDSKGSQGKNNNIDDENEDGEVNSEDDLEEGEVKEESEDESLISFMKKLPLPALTPRQQQQLLLQQTQQRAAQTATKSICKFFHKGQCTWGPSCRFLHQNPAGIKPNAPRKFPFPQPIPGPIRPRQPEEFFPGHPVPPVIHPPPPMPRLLLPHGPPMPQPALQPNPLPLPPPPPPPTTTPAVLPAASSSSHEPESPWERGVRQAKQMMIKAIKRKEEEIDFDEKKFNLGVEDEGASRNSHHSLETSPNRGRSPSPYRREHWSPEYERRRRLAFEAAPWNDEPPQTSAPAKVNPSRGREIAEQYRDPWRRSKSPTGRKVNPKRPESSSGKRSHSMSSISGSDSGSEQSSTTFSSSFSGSDSNLSEASNYEKSPVPHFRKVNPQQQQQQQQQKLHKAPPNYGPQKAKQQKQQLPPQRTKVGPKHDIREKGLSSHQQNLNAQVPTKSQARIYNREEIVEQKKKPLQTKARRDSWSDSDTGSDSQSDSSFYTGSESGSDQMSESEEEKKNVKQQKRIPPNIKQAMNKQVINRIKDSMEIPGPSSKRIKTNQPGTTAGGLPLRANKSDKVGNKMQRNVSPLDSSAISPYTHNQPSKSSVEPTQKRPIKMTFMKKHHNLQKDTNVAAKLNGGRGTDNEDQEDAKLDNDNMASELTSPEPIPESSCKEDLLDSPKSGSKDSLIQSSCDNKPKSSGSAVVSSTTGGNSSTSSRREELLKQLKAVEDAIARKRAKLH